MANNKKQLRNFIDQVWNQQNMDAINNFITDDYVEHTPFGDFNGADEFRGFVSMNLRAFPDFSVRIHEIIAENDWVACYYTSSGTHKKEYLGIDPTNNRMDVNGCYMGRMQNGKVLEAWNQFDVMTILTGLEVITPDMLGGMEEMGGGRGMRG